MGKYNPYLEVEVSAKETNDGQMLLTFYGIKSKSDFDNIIDRLCMPAQANSFGRQPYPTKNISKVWAAKGLLFVIVPKDKMDAFIDSGLKSIQSALIATRNYDDDMILRLTDEVAQVFDKPSKEEMNKMFADASVSEIDMWTNYINKMNDPNMVKVLELYSKIYGDTSYGHVLSLKNAMTIRNLNDQATFVCGKSTWAAWGYGVKRGAKKYPLWGGSRKSVKDLSADDIKKAMEALGHGLEEFGDLGVAVKQEVMIQASKDAKKNKTVFIPFKYIGYDISDTYRYNPKEEDPLTSKPNISSNVIYALNALAQEAENKKNTERGKAIEGDDLMKDKTQKAIKAIEELCVEKGVNVNTNIQNMNSSALLVDDLIKLYSTMVTKKANVIKAGNIEDVAEDCTHLTLIMAGIGLDQLNRFKHPLVYTQKDMNALAPIMRYVIPVIGKAMVEEGFGDNFMKRLKMAMKQIGMKVVPDKEDNVQVDNTNVQNGEEQINEISKSFKEYMKRLDEASFSKVTRFE